MMTGVLFDALLNPICWDLLLLLRIIKKCRDARHHDILFLNVFTMAAIMIAVAASPNNVG